MLLALIAFVVLLVMGVSLEEITWGQAGMCILLAVAALVAFAALHWPLIAYFSGLAIADVILILVVFKGDIVIR